MKSQSKQMTAKTRIVLVIAGIMLIHISSWAQSARTLTGMVYDENQQPLIGVFVQSVEEPAIKTMTNGDGQYTLVVNDKTKMIEFSLIGYCKKQLMVTTGTMPDVTLQPDTASLSELVVIGYGVQKRQNKNSKAYAAAPQRNCIKFTPPVIKADEQVAEEEYSTTEVSVVDYDKGTDDIAVPIAPEPIKTQKDEEFNTENYSAIEEVGFKEVAREPLSTFSVDVDKASYANIRRFLNDGQLPPAGAVRIEEMINYFTYNYEQPTDSKPFATKTDMAVCPWNSNHYLLKIGIKGREMDKASLPSSNLVFLLDVSGSMDEPNKLPLLKSAFKLLVNELRPNDKVAIVVYAGAAGVVLPSTPGNKKEQIIDALEQLQAGGSTAGGEGLHLAYKIANENFIKGGNNRIILATDGDFNIGESSNSAMEDLVSQQRDKGVMMTVLGFGMGNYKDDRMEIIADKGNGNYAYIDNLQEARKTLVGEFGGTLFTIAKDVKLQLEFNPSKVAAYRLIGYENRRLNNEDFNDDKKDAGEIGAGHTVTALYEVVPVSSPDANELTHKVDALKYQQTTTMTNNNEWLTLKLRYKKPDADESQLIQQAVTDAPLAFEDADNDFRFASSVAGFGLILRQSQYKGDLTYEMVTKIAVNAKGIDEEGYRGEMVRLIKLAKTLTPSSSEISMIKE
jgi:Ca-activated chloride channel family protein